MWHKKKPMPRGGLGRAGAPPNVSTPFPSWLGVRAAAVSLNNLPIPQTKTRPTKDNQGNSQSDLETSSIRLAKSAGRRKLFRGYPLKLWDIPQKVEAGSLKAIYRNRAKTAAV